MVRVLLVSFLISLVCLSSTVLAKSNKGQDDVTVDKYYDLGRLDVTAFLPKPPDSDSLLFQYDKQCYEKGKMLRQNPEVSRQAAEAADTHTLPEFFSEAFGMDISKNNLPVLRKMIKRIRKTFGKSADVFKSVYGRERPFVLYGDGTCFRSSEDKHRQQSSYPSGHSTRGWGVALLLSEINPERAEQILKRGIEFGQSRVICGYHWQSDVDAGRLLASALFARLHANTEFLADLEKAKAEYALARSQPERKHSSQ